MNNLTDRVDKMDNRLSTILMILEGVAKNISNPTPTPQQTFATHDITPAETMAELDQICANTEWVIMIVFFSANKFDYIRFILKI